MEGAMKTWTPDMIVLAWPYIYVGWEAASVKVNIKSSDLLPLINTCVLAGNNRVC